MQRQDKGRLHRSPALCSAIAAKRGGKVYVDFLQNRHGSTIVTPFGVRPRPGAPVSTPLLWDEVGAVQPSDFTIATIWDRLQRFGDLFAPVLSGGQTLDAAEHALGIDDHS